MKTCFILALSAVLVAAPFCLRADEAEKEYAIKKGDVIINELMWMGINGKSSNEWIELKNASGKSINLENCIIYSYKEDKSRILNKAEIGIIPMIAFGAGKFIIVTYKKFPQDIFDIVYYPILSYYALSDTNLKISLECNGEIIDEVGDGNKPFAGEKNGIRKSMERNGNNGTKKESWHTCNIKLNPDLELSDYATPGVENSKEEIALPKEKPIEAVTPVVEEIKIGNITKDEHVYPNMYADFAIEKKDDEKVTWTFGDGHRSYKAITKHKYEAVGTYAASVKVYKGKENAVQNFTVTVEEYPRPKVKIIALNANPKGSDTKKETITIENKTKQKINLKGWSVATGWKKFVNHPIREDFFIKPGKEKQLTRDKCAFTLVNSKDKIELRYPDGEVADEVKYKKAKDESVAEGEEYVKGKKGWKWVALATSEKSIKQNQDNNQKTIPNNQIVSIKPEIKKEDVVVELDVIVRDEVGFIGKNKIELAVAKIETKPKVLGAQNMREESGQYFFTPLVTQKHYAVAFVEKVLISANSWINDILNNL